MALELPVESKRAKQIVRFINKMRELKPIVSLATRMARNEGVEANVKIASLYKIRQDCLITVCDKLNLDFNSIDDHELIDLVAEHIGELINELCNSGEPLSSVIEIIDSIHGFSIAKSTMANIIQPGVFEADMLAIIKISLFPNAVKIKKILDAIGVSDDDVSIWTSWYHSAAVDLGKDVAFNWDSQSAIRDREAIFKSCLKSCSDIVFDEFRSYIFESMDSERCYQVYSSLWQTMPKLYKCILNFDVGYASNPDYSLNWLEDRIGALVFPVVSAARKMALSEDEQRKTTGFIAFKIEKLAIESWEFVTEQTVADIEDKIKNFNQDELAKWIQNEGSEVMDFNLFKVEFESRLSQFSYSLQEIGIKINVLNARAKSTTAKLWGLSDTFCKIRPINV
jgi:hypothetical protein